jgi:hypothetical protein
MKNISIMMTVAVASMFALSLVAGSSADRIKPPGESVVAPNNVDRVSEIETNAEPADAYGALRRMLSVKALAPNRRSMVPLSERDSHPEPPKVPATRRIVMIGAVTGGDGATTYWFRDLDGTEIYPLVSGGDEVDGWQLVSIDKGTAVLSIENGIFHVKEK